MAGGLHTLGRLDVLGAAGLARGFVELLELAFAHLGQALAAGQQVHGEFLEVGHVQVVELVQRGAVLQQRHLIALKCAYDLVDVGVGLVVASLQRAHLGGLLLEQAEEALLLLGVEALELGDHVHDQLARFAQILGAHLVEGRFGEACHLRLGAGAVLQHHLGVGDVDLLREGLHLGALICG